MSSGSCQRLAIADRAHKSGLILHLSSVVYKSHRSQETRWWMGSGMRRKPSEAPGDGTVYANMYSINVSNSGSVFKFDCFLMWPIREFSLRLAQRCAQGSSIHLFFFVGCLQFKKSLTLWLRFKKKQHLKKLRIWRKKTSKAIISSKS